MQRAFEFHSKPIAKWPLIDKRVYEWWWLNLAALSPHVAPLPKCGSACKRMGLALRSRYERPLCPLDLIRFMKPTICSFSPFEYIGEYASMKLWTLFEVAGICWATRIENLRFCAGKRNADNRGTTAIRCTWNDCWTYFGCINLLCSACFHTQRIHYFVRFVRFREFSAFRGPFECKKNNT